MLYVLTYKEGKSLYSAEEADGKIDRLGLGYVTSKLFHGIDVKCNCKDYNMYICIGERI